MVQYRRNRVPGGTYFFTLTLANRSERTLVEQIDALRWSLRKTRAERPFEIVAMVILPDHLHAIWRLPEGDAAYARIYWWAADRYFKSQFFDSKVDCGRMMRGIDRILQIYPDPWNLNHFAKFAVSCGDKKRAKLLFERIGGNPDLDAWKGSTLTFTRFRAWAME